LAIVNNDPTDENSPNPVTMFLREQQVLLNSSCLSNLSDLVSVLGKCVLDKKMTFADFQLFFTA
jgi:hypothetical protein